VLRSPIRNVDLIRKYDSSKNFISKEISGAFANGVVIGLSGGLDSSVALKIASDALKPENILGLMLPESGVTPKLDLEDATKYAKMLSVQVKTIDIRPLVKAFGKALPDHKLAEGNLKARIRMSMLYYYANLETRLVLGTGDRSELLLGYYTKYGDGGVDLLPLGNVYKTEVRVIAEYLGLPDSITTKPSSPRLWPGHIAEDELGVTYDVADKILVLMTERGLTAQEIKKELMLDSEVDQVARRLATSVHKREMPHISP